MKVPPTYSGYDAILVVSFGGPEGRDEVIPFLQNVLRGKPVPHARMQEVAEHYYQFGGVSPLNQQCRDLIAALRNELDAHGIALPIYWGNRNWHPLLEETLAEMKAAGSKRALAFMTSAYSSYSGCRQYRENVAAAQARVGAGAPAVDKLRVFYNHPDFVAACADRLSAALEEIAEERRDGARLVFTAHSLPQPMADGCEYVPQLRETCRLVAEQLGVSDDRWQLVYQSRSGRPQDPWLEPDVVDALRQLHEQGAADAVVSPIGFLSDHLEVLYDLDHVARNACEAMGLRMVRAATVGTHPRFVAMIRKLIEERVCGGEREAIGRFGPHQDDCPEDCCPRPMPRPPQ